MLVLELMIALLIFIAKVTGKSVPVVILPMK